MDASGIPDSAGYSLVYDIMLPLNANWSSSNLPPYTVDNTDAICDFDRVAYYLKLDGEWVWGSMDDFTGRDVSKVGIPYSWPWDTNATNMNVASNKAGVTTGNIEFWNSAYYVLKDGPAPGGDGTTYDFDDTINTLSTYGSMQVHDHAAGNAKTVLGYNRWAVGNFSDFGIGNNPLVHPDWTLRQNSNDYAIRQLQIYVRRSPTARPGLLANDSDPDNIQSSLVVSRPSTPRAFGGAVVNVASDGSFTYDPRSCSTLQSLGTGESVVDTFTYVTSDGSLTSSATVSVLVTGVNDPPVLAVNGGMSVGRGTTPNPLTSALLIV